MKAQEITVISDYWTISTFFAHQDPFYNQTFTIDVHKVVKKKKKTLYFQEQTEFVW